MKVLAIIGLILIPTVTWAGNAMSPVGAPAMDESGLFILGSALVGTGAYLLRWRKK